MSHDLAGLLSIHSPNRGDLSPRPICKLHLVDRGCANDSLDNSGSADSQAVNTVSVAAPISAREPYPQSASLMKEDSTAILHTASELAEIFVNLSDSDTPERQVRQLQTSIASTLFLVEAICEVLIRLLRFEGVWGMLF